jgi:hypothetical protein
VILLSWPVGYAVAIVAEIVGVHGGSVQATVMAEGTAWRPS